MRTLPTNHAHRTWFRNTLTLLALVVVALGIELLKPSTAKADIRVRARVNTPVLDVEWNSHPRPVRYKRVGRRPARPIVMREEVCTILTRHDRNTARRLAHLTGYRKNLLLDLRRDGMSWWRIGRYLDIDSYLVSVSLNERHYRRHVHRHQYDLGSCGR